MSNRNFPSLLLEEWHPTLNNGKKLTDFTTGSNATVWWLSGCGHEWDSRVSHRTLSQVSCPICRGKRVLAGFNDFASLAPASLVSQWHPTKNVLSPFEVTVKSSRKVWWLGECGHEWDTSVNNRSIGKGCPVCSNRVIIAGVNDFATKFPHLLVEWDYVKNTVLPSTLSVGSSKKFWWLCSKGHSSTTSIHNRVKGWGCGVCSGSAAARTPALLSSEVDAAVTSFFDVGKNSCVLSELTDGMNVIVWWKCVKGHSFSKPYCQFRKSLACQQCKSVAVYAPELLTEWDYVKNTVTPDEVSYGSGLLIWWKCGRGHSYQSAPCDRTGKKKSGCGSCTSRVSRGEQEVIDFVRALLPGERMLTSVSGVAGRKEVDVYLPDRKFAIEYNGLYWHSEARGISRSYHEDKWLACKDNGVQLVQLWEDDWLANPELLKRMLAHKLGVSGERKVFARNTVVTSLPFGEASKFLDANHIQGGVVGSSYSALSMLVNGSYEVVAVLVCKKGSGVDAGVLNIVRYATSANVVGGFTKLLKHVERTFNPERFVTFSDHCVSDGSLYAGNGFVADKILAPDYMYIVDGVRKHKFGYRLKRFRDDPGLEYEAGLTEQELAVLNGLSRVYDAGKTRWVKECL